MLTSACHNNDYAHIALHIAFNHGLAIIMLLRSGSDQSFET